MAQFTVLHNFLIFFHTYRILKEKRRREQNQNLKKKELEKEEHKAKSLEGIEKKRNELLEEPKKRVPIKRINKNLLETDRLMRKAVVESQETAQNSDDDDAEWYRKEVGEEPEKGKTVLN